MKREDGITPTRENCVYSSCYCEENVWKLCEFVKKERTAPLEHLSVVFISNENRMDYHVILMVRGLQSDALVYDLDSELSFPCSLKLYGAKALRSDRSIRPEYHRKLRVVPADSFLLKFASDRSHMKAPDGSWKMPPPPYPPIHTAESHMNLDDFISMDPAVGWGTVLSLDQFLRSYAENSSSASSSASSSVSSSASSLA
nr:PREDICTED: protein N-terminal glutamine amidohydrolase isoform X2 [Paralichthys olivaceus]